MALGLRIQLASQSRPLGDPAPPLVPAVLAADVSAGRQRPVTGPVGQRPLPRQHLGFPAAPGRPSPASGR
jgi:hypothetical protein